MILCFDKESLLDVIDNEFNGEIRKTLSADVEELFNKRMLKKIAKIHNKFVERFVHVGNGWLYVSDDKDGHQIWSDVPNSSYNEILRELGLSEGHSIIATYIYAVVGNTTACLDSPLTHYSVKGDKLYIKLQYNPQPDTSGPINIE